eukprot:scaffold75832_cov39-Cyclotella_meneghiniana.AAC.8
MLSLHTRQPVTTSPIMIFDPASLRLDSPKNILTVVINPSQLVQLGVSDRPSDSRFERGVAAKPASICKLQIELESSVCHASVI